MLNPQGKKWKVYVAIPSTGEVHDYLPYMLREMESRYGDEVEFIYPSSLCQRIFHDFARNGLVDDFLASDAEIMWFIDSDVVPQKHCLELVTRYGNVWQAAGSPYPVFMAQAGMPTRQIVFTVYKGINADGKSLRPASIPFEGNEMVDGIATGCMFIKREVFSKLSKPYFEFKYNPETREPVEGEDLGFCLKLSKLGIQFFVDYSTVAKHQKKLCLLELNNYAMGYANQAVLAYDKIVRDKVGYLEKKIHSLQQKFNSA